MTRQQERWSKLFLHIVLCLPASWLLWRVFTNHLGADPAKALVDQTGLWAFRILLLSLAMTPLRMLSHWSGWIRYRRLLGLWAFFYALSHFLIYTFLLFGADWSALAGELTKRPYIIVGFISLVLLVPLAVTSTQRWQKRLGRKWVKLHQLVYVISLLALTHFIWLKKLGLYAVWPYALVLVLLLAMRCWKVIASKSLRNA